MKKWLEKHVKRKFCRVAKILVLFYTQFDFCFNARLLICLVGSDIWEVFTEKMIKLTIHVKGIFLLHNL